jgi:hypothetical protein
MSGVLVAIGLKGFLIGMAPPNLPRLSQISLDGRVLAFVFGVTITCGILVGLIPAVRLLKFDLESALRTENARNATSHTRARTYEPLLALQVALTLALLVGSGLMIKGLERLFAVAPGFDTSNLITTTLSLPGAKHAWKYNATFSERVVARIRAVPGVEAAGAIRGLPLNEARFDGSFRRWDQQEPDPPNSPVMRIRVVGDGYFKAIGIPMLAGRDFVPQDGVGEVGITKVVVINKALALLYWQDRDPIGQKLVTNNLTMEVIGVVADARYSSMEAAPVPEVYYPNGVFPQDEISVVIRTAASPDGWPTSSATQSSKSSTMSSFRRFEEWMKSSQLPFPIVDSSWFF